MFRFLLIFYGDVSAVFSEILQRENRISCRQVLEVSPAGRRGAVQPAEDPVLSPDLQVHPLIQCYSHIPAILQQQADFPLTPDAGAAKGYAGGLYHLIAPAPDGAVLLRAVQERAEGQHPAEYQQHAIPKSEKHSQSHQQKPDPCGAGENPPAPQHGGPFLKRKPIHTLHPLKDDLLVQTQVGDRQRNRPPALR